MFPVKRVLRNFEGQVFSSYVNSVLSCFGFEDEDLIVLGVRGVGEEPIGPGQVRVGSQAHREVLQWLLGKGLEDDVSLTGFIVEEKDLSREVCEKTSRKEEERERERKGEKGGGHPGWAKQSLQTGNSSFTGSGIPLQLLV